MTVIPKRWVTASRRTSSPAVGGFATTPKEVVEAHVIRYLVPPSLDTTTVNNPLGTPNPRTLIGTAKHLISSLVNTKSRTGHCVFP